MKQPLQIMARSITSWEVTLLLLLLAVAMIQPQLWPLALLIPPLFWLGRRAILGRFLPATPYNALLFTLLVLVLLSAYVFPFTHGSGKAGLLGLSILLYFALAQFMQEDSDNIPIVVIGSLLIGLGMALFGLLGTEWQPPFELLNEVRNILPDAMSPLLSAGAVGTNELAGVLGWITPLMVALLIGLRQSLHKSSPWLVVGLGAMAAGSSLLLIATASRGGILAFAFGVAVILALIVEPRWRLAVATSAGVALLVIFFTYSNPRLAAAAVEDAVGLRGRQEIWQRGIEALSAFPLTGVGLNGFRSVVPVTYPLFATPTGIDIAHGHNQVLQAGLDLGMVGLVSYVAIWLLTAVLLVQVISTLRSLGHLSHFYGVVAIGLAGSFAASWLFGLVDAVSLGSKPGFLWWALLAILASVHHEVVVKKAVGHRHRRRRMSTTGTDAEESVVTAAATDHEEQKRLLPPAPLPARSSPRIEIPRPHGERPPLPPRDSGVRDRRQDLPRPPGEL